MDGELFIKSWEELCLKAYLCQAKKPTIGWGHTKGVKLGDEITIEEAQRLFEEDIKWAKDCVSNNVKVPLTSRQFDVLVSFVYNVGETNFKNSTLLRHLNKGWYERVPVELLRWNKVTVNGVKETSGGLTRRRKAEIKMWREE